MRSALIVAIALNMICVVALLWSATERLHVTVVVTATSATGIVGGASVTTPFTDPSAGELGLFLQGADPHAAAQWPDSRPGATPSAEPSVHDLLYRLAAESAWTNVQVKDLTTGRALSPTGVAAPDGTGWHSVIGDWFRHPLGGMTTSPPGLATFGSFDWHSYQLDADLLRPRNAAGVLVLSPDGTNGLLFYFRPEDRDAMWFRVQDGVWSGPLASAPFHAFGLEPVEGVQDVLRLALGGYPGAVAIFVAALALGAGEMMLREQRHRRRSLGQNRATAREAPTFERGTGIADDGGSPGSGTRRELPLRERGRAGPPVGTPRYGEEAILPLVGPIVASTALDSEDTLGRPVSRPRAPRIRAQLPTSSILPVAHRLTGVAAMLLTLGALAATLYIADVILQRMPHVQDSVAYLFQAKTFALGRLWVPLPAHPDFFKHEFIVMDHGRWFSKYPPGWPMLLALGVLVSQPWVVNPICGALSIYLIYRLGAEIYRPWVGLLAATLGVVSPFFLFLSGSMMSHSSGLLFALLFSWAFWRASQSPRPLWWALLAGAACGMGIMIRPLTMIVIAVPFSLYALYQTGRQPGDGLKRYVAVALAAAPFVVAFLAYNWYFTGNALYPPQQLWWPFDSLGFGPQHGPWGFTPRDALNNTSRNLLELLEHTYGWPEFLTLSLAMAPFLTGRFRVWDWIFAGAFVGLVAGYGLWWADGIMFGPRFYYEGLGFLLLLTARGVQATVDLARSVASPPRPLAISDGEGGSSAPAGDRSSPRHRRWRGAGDKAAPVAVPALALLLVAGLIAYNFAFYFPGQWQLYHGYNYVNHSKLDAVEEAGIHHAVVFADVGQWYEWWEYGMVFSANDPLLQDDVIFARDLGDAADRVLMADFPGRSYYRLDGTTITQLNPSAAG